MVRCNSKRQGKCALYFALGLTCSCLFPDRFVIGIVAIVVIVLAVSLIRR